MPNGIDIDSTCQNHVAALHQARVEFVCRYYSITRSKRLTVSEAKALSAAGIKLVAIWETNPTSADYFSHDKGLSDGAEACRQAKMLGQPAGSAIYFAVDYDAADSEIRAQITDYFRGVEDGIQAIGAGPPL